jgi:hypothetical protein
MSKNVAAAILAASEGGILPPVPRPKRGWKHREKARLNEREKKSALVTVFFPQTF